MSIASMSAMLQICNDILPDSEVTYIAFRLACCDTLERIVLAEQVADTAERPFGYLTQVPFLQNVAPQVQVDLLVRTWSKHRNPQIEMANLVDESVVYAVCETAAQLVVSDPATAERLLKQGPRPVTRRPSSDLSRELQALHLRLSNDGDFLLISQFQDIPTDEARVLKAKFGLDPAAAEPMFEALGLWHVESGFARRAAGLLSAAEATRTEALFGQPRAPRMLPG